MKSAVEEFSSSQGVEIILTRDEHPATWLMVKYFFHSFGVGTDFGFERDFFRSNQLKGISMDVCSLFV